MFERYAEDAFVLIVTALAIIWPPLALLGAGVFFVVLAVIHWRAARSIPLTLVQDASDEAAA